MSLKAKTIVVTRPEEQAQPLMTALKEQQATVIALPTIIIAPLAAKPLPKDYQCDVIIFTSVNAVIHGLEFLPQLTQTKVIAVGEATAQKLAQHHIDSIVPPTKNSEGILSLPELQPINKRAVLIVTGKNGRGLLQQSLTEQGAVVTLLEVYERQCPNVDATPIIQQAPNYIIITSADALKNLCQMTPQKYHPQLFNLKLVVISQRIANIAVKLGFKKPVLISDGGATAAIIAALN